MNLGTKEPQNFEYSSKNASLCLDFELEIIDILFLGNSVGKRDVKDYWLVGRHVVDIAS